MRLTRSQEEGEAVAAEVLKFREPHKCQGQEPGCCINPGALESFSTIP